MYSWIRTEREVRNLSQSKLSQLTSLSQAKLSSWEHRKSSPSEEEEKQVRLAFANFDSLTAVQRKAFLHGKTRWSQDYDSKRIGSTARREILANDVERFAKTVDHMFTGSQKFEAPAGAYHKPKVLALFAGCGGMALGFQEAGFDVVGHVEIENAARKVFECNFVRSKRIGTDIREVSDSAILEFAANSGPIEVVVGGPPCQGFSLTGKRDVYDPRNQLYKEFARFVRLANPRHFLMENVRLLTSMKTPDGSLLIKDLVNTFEAIGYSVQVRSLNAMNFGVAQSRERLFVAGTRKDNANRADLCLPFETHAFSPNKGNLFDTFQHPLRVLRDAIGDLELLESGQASELDPLHFAVAHPSHVIDMLKDVPEGSSAHEHPDPEKRPRSGYNTTYKRLRWDEPASTISTTFGMISGSRNVHPTSTRSLTIREAARCQSFPDDFIFFGSLGDVRTMIGNAVPPKLACAIGKSVLKVLSTDRTTAKQLVEVSSL